MTTINAPKNSNDERFPCATDSILSPTLLTTGSRMDRHYTVSGSNAF